MHEAPPLYVVRSEEARSGRVLFNSTHEGELMPLLREDGEIGAKVLAADGRKYWSAHKRREAARAA